VQASKYTSSASTRRIRSMISGLENLWKKKVMTVELNGLYAEILIILTSMKVKHHINMAVQSFKHILLYHNFVTEIMLMPKVFPSCLRALM
jgi:hypothetical protein